MATNRNLDIIYYNRETIVIIPILDIYWQDIFTVRLSHDLCVTHVSPWMEPIHLAVNYSITSAICKPTYYIVLYSTSAV